MVGPVPEPSLKGSAYIAYIHWLVDYSDVDSASE